MGLISSKRWPGIFVNEDRVVADEGGIADAYERDTYRIRELRDVRLVLDVGAHVGGASVLIHECFPDAHIVAVEACPENIPCLVENVGTFATVVQAAVSYEPGPLFLASTVGPGCRSSGSSVVTTRERWDARTVPWTWYLEDYHLDDRPLRITTIEELMREHGLPRLDLLKLDCEGSEVSILRGFGGFHRVRTVVGEYHDADFEDAVPADWLLERWEGRLFRRALPADGQLDAR